MKKIKYLFIASLGLLFVGCSTINEFKVTSEKETQINKEIDSISDDSTTTEETPQTNDEFDFKSEYPLALFKEDFSNQDDSIKSNSLFLNVGESFTIKEDFGIIEATLTDYDVFTDQLNSERKGIAFSFTLKQASENMPDLGFVFYPVVLKENQQLRLHIQNCVLGQNCHPDSPDYITYPNIEISQCQQLNDKLIRNEEIFCIEYVDYIGPGEYIVSFSNKEGKDIEEDFITYLINVEE